MTGDTQTRPRFPWIATLVVLIAVTVMVRLGFWQLDRLLQKEAMIARFVAVQADISVHPYPSNDDIAPLDYSRVRMECTKILGQTAVAGENAQHQSGWALQAECALTHDGKGRVKVRLGWANQPTPVVWTGGVVQGTLLHEKILSDVIVADPPLAGLQPNARPDPRNLPNNHFSYAVQWFLFAGTALVIYAIALRKRLKGKG